MASTKGTSTRGFPNIENRTIVLLEHMPHEEAADLAPHLEQIKTSIRNRKDSLTAVLLL